MDRDGTFSISALDDPVLVLNRSWLPIQVTTVRRALCLVYGDGALVVAADTLQTHHFEEWVFHRGPGIGRWIRAASFAIPAPEVIQLTRYDKVPAYEAPFTRRNLYQRDNYTCQYCGERHPPDRLSIDHVLPRSRGGQTTWDNCVLACVRCNTRKGDRTLQEVSLRLIRRPCRPRWSPYLTLARERHLPSWRRFLPARLQDGNGSGS